jgi:hypothetical protein
VREVAWACEVGRDLLQHARIETDDPQRVVGDLQVEHVEVDLEVLDAA